MTTFAEVMAEITGSAPPDPLESRFTTGFRQGDSDLAGLVLGDDGIVYLVHPDGTRTAVGGGGSQPSVPIADSDYTIDTTTYDNPVTGSGKIATLVFPATTTAFAIALEGDAFPRWCFASDPVGDDLTIGDGTINPDGGHGAYLGVNAKQADGSTAMQIGGSGGGMSLGKLDALRGRAVNDTIPLRVAGHVTILSGDGDPAGVVNGNVGDLYIRRDWEGEGTGTFLYACVSAGNPGGWTGVV